MKRLLFVLCTVCVLLVCFSASAEIVLSGNCGQSGEDLQFTLDNQGLLRIFGKGHVTKTFNEYIFDYVMKEVVIEEGTLSIGEHAFDSCSDIKSVSLPESLMSIGNEAFYGCGWLPDITIPDHVTVIGQNVFGKCEGMKSAVIGAGVARIDNNAFYDCLSLRTITFRGKTAPKISAGAFSGVDATVYYAKHKSDWNDMTIQQYGGKLTWQRTDALTGLDITTHPKKTVYFEEETFDTTGMVVTASFKDGTKDTDIVYTVSPSGPLTLQTSVVTIAYTDEDGVQKTVNQPITVLKTEIKTGRKLAVKALSMIAGANASPEVRKILASYTDKINASVTVEEIDALMEEGAKAIKTQQEKEKKDPVADIRLNKSKKTLYARQDTKNGDKLQLTAAVTKSDPDIELPAVLWKSSNQKIAAVDQSGLVKIKNKAGKVTITASCGNKTASCVITVKRVDKEVTGLSGIKKKLTMKIGETRELNVKLKPAASYWNKLKWTTSNRRIVKVSAANRTLKAVGKGKCKVTISSAKKPSVKLTIMVTVR